MSGFAKALNHGKIGEGLIATWLRYERNCTILPVYDKEIGSGKGPQLFTPSAEIVAPDMLIRKEDVLYFGEAKIKTVFTWHRNTSRWVTGIDLRHYEEYKRAEVEFGCAVWMFFLHTCSTPNRRDVQSCPGECPVGLFIGELKHLRESEHHKSDKWGPSGMVYWAHDTLTLFATLSEVYECAQRAGKLEAPDA